MSRFHGNIPTCKQLEKYYVEENLSLKHVAMRLNTSTYMVRKMLDKYKIPANNRGPIKKPARKQLGKQLTGLTKEQQEPLITVHTDGIVEGDYWQNLAKCEANRPKREEQHGQAIARQRKPRGTKLG